MKRILNLTLKRKWFDLIASGRKKIEYREKKPYWEVRLLENGKFKNFDEIHFKNGYGKHVPFMRVEFKNTVLVHSNKHKPKNGEILNG